MLPILSIGPLSLPVPPLVLLAGFWLGSSIAERQAGRQGRSTELVEKVLWYVLISGLIGARISFFARNTAAFQGQLLSIFSLNPALLDPLGGLLIGLAVGYYLISQSEADLLSILDDFVPFFAVMIIAVHFSQFAAGKGYGTFTQLPWGVEIWGGYRHPVQIYYAVSGLIVFGLLQARFLPRDHRPGKAFLTLVIFTSGYLTFLSLFQDPGIYQIGGFRIFQILYWVTFSTALLIDHKFYQDRSNEQNQHSKF